MAKLGLFLFLLVVCLLASALAQRVQLEQGADVPASWQRGERTAANKIVSLTFALKISNAAELEKTFWAVSEPQSASYGKHWTMAEVDKLTAPSADARRALDTWLASEGIDKPQHCKASQGSGFLVCSVTASTAEQLLQTRFYDFTHTQWPEPLARADASYSVPAVVAPYLDFVGGVHRFPSFKLRPRIEAPAPIIGITPNVLRGRYNLTRDDVGKYPSNSQAVASFLGQYFSQADIKEFFHQFGNRFVHRDSIEKIVGPDTGFSGVEAALDTEYIMSLGANITTWFWSTKGERQGQEPFLDWIIAVGNTSGAPPVHSVSYGDDEYSLDVPFMTRINQEFQKLGVRGFSILFASGDDGAGCNDTHTKFVPNFPASSPYVTAVGGTLFAHSGRDEDGNYISGGGFSNVFAQPSYQTAAVKHFLATSTRLPAASFYNASGRAYPDIAAASNGFWVVANRFPMPGVAGTSCAAPTASGIVAMLNDRRLSAGKSTLGFLNPLLYQNGGSLYDVVSGCNAGCGQTGFCSQAGWDPVTGMGTPDFARLSKL